MQSEHRIRQYRDALRRVVDGLAADGAPDDDARTAFFFMESHMRLLTWVLDGDDEVEGVVRKTLLDVRRLD